MWGLGYYCEDPDNNYWSSWTLRAPVSYWLVPAHGHYFLIGEIFLIYPTLLSFFWQLLLSTMPVPSLFDLLPLFIDENACNKFLLNQQVCYNTLDCPGCGQSMGLSAKEGRFRCHKRTCRKNVSIKIHSFFYGHSLECSKILHLGYMWVNKVSVTAAIAMSGHDSKTVCAFWKHFRQLVASDIQ